MVSLFMKTIRLVSIYHINNTQYTLGQRVPANQYGHTTACACDRQQELYKSDGHHYTVHGLEKALTLQGTLHPLEG